MMRPTTFRLMRSLFAGAFLGMTMLVTHAGPKESIQDDMTWGRWAQAEEELVVVLEKHPNNPLAHYWRAQVKAKLGDMAAARDELAAAKRIDPSLKFAGSREALAKLESRIAEPEGEGVKPDAGDTSSDDLVAPLTTLQTSPAQPVDLDSPVETAHGNVWVYAIWLLGFAAAGVAGSLVFEKRAEKRRLQEARERWAAKLRDAKANLDDAIKKSDGNIDLAPEVRLGNYDRYNAARNSISTQLGTIQKAESFREAELAVARAHDIAADVRGEETPTARAERLEAEERAERMAASRSAGRSREVRHYHDGGSNSSIGGGSLLRDAALIGGGALLASALTSSASAHERSSSGGESHQNYEPIADDGNAGDDIDLGGTAAGGDASFDVSSSGVDNDFS